MTSPHAPTVPASATAIRCQAVIAQEAGAFGFEAVICRQTVGVRTFETDLYQKVGYCAIDGHEASVRRRFREVGPAEPEHTHFDDRDATLRDCPACDELVEKYAGVS